MSSILQAQGPIGLRRFVVADAASFVDLVRANAGHCAPYVFPPDSVVAFEAYLQRAEGDDFEAFAIVDLERDAVIGAITMSQIFRGAFQSAYLGFWIAEGFVGRGQMEIALCLLLRQAFLEMDLHRLEANIQPGNVRSIGLVRKCGFVLEGFSERYLKIDGEWRDHERWAIHREIWKTE